MKGLRLCGLSVFSAVTLGAIGCRDVLGIHELWDNSEAGTDAAADADGSEGPAKGDSSLQEGSADQTVVSILDGAISDANEGSADGASDVGAADAPGDSTCTAGGLCALGDCKTGQLVCGEGGLTCQDAGTAANGSPCGSLPGHVCNAGSCVACNAGSDCSIAGSCTKKTIECSSGQAQCVEAGLAPESTPCGTSAGMYCYSGICSGCTVNAACTPLNSCHKGTVSSCAGSVATCTDTMANADNGTSCGDNKVCSGGQCSPCTSGITCNPPGTVCQTGKTSCASGQSRCAPTGSVSDGTPCDDGDACTTNDKCASGTCTGTAMACAASDQCHGVGTCSSATGVCSNPALSNTPCDPGNACVTSAKCQNGACMGTPVSCLPPDSCHSAGTCSAGTCSNYSPLADNTPCGTNKSCQSGTCSCNSGYTPCGGNCVDIHTDNSNCGSCGKTCPALSSPSSGATCDAAACTGFVGGYVQAPGTFDLDNNTIYAFKAPMPTAGKFVTLAAKVGSSDPSGTTYVYLGLYADNGSGAPGRLLFYGGTSFANPSVPVPVTLSGGTYVNGFNGQLSANGTYWVSLKTIGSASTSAALSSSPCVAAMGVNATPPDPWANFPVSCGGLAEAYLIANF